MARGQIMGGSGKVLLWWVALWVAVGVADAHSGRQTVCTITINSPDEKEVLRRNLPADRFDFVELVEHGRPDWLASACRKEVRCDILVVSGHFDSGTQFYSDRLNVREYLPIDDLERASCSNSCPGLFSQLKEVYLLGCNTLDPAPVQSATPEVLRSLLRSGYGPAEAERRAHELDILHGESSRDHMRRIFKDVPVLYGFSSVAPLGATAGPLLNRYLQSRSTVQFGSGQVDTGLVRHFAGNSMTVAAGLRDSDPDADLRRDNCRFVDDRQSTAQKLRFVHQLLGRDMAEVRVFLPRIEALLASMSAQDRAAPAAAEALGDIRADAAARERYLVFARDADQPAIRQRMLEVAGTLGWLSPEQQRAETLRMMGDYLARSGMGLPEVELICALNKDHAYDGELARVRVPPAHADRVAPAAGLACLGSLAGRAQILEALTSASEQEVEIAQLYLKYRPITEVGELRTLAGGIARMGAVQAQIRALETLARYYLSDQESLQVLAGLFPKARSLGVQRAIADLIIRSDYRRLPKPDLIRMLSRYRVKSPDGTDSIDILIRRLQAS
jgi:hypothetical protein